MAEPLLPTHFWNIKNPGKNLSNGEVGVTAMIATNASVTAAWIQVFNVASTAVTLGTTRPLFCMAVPSGSTTELLFSPPARFDTRLSAFGTTTPEGAVSIGDGVHLQILVN